MTNFFFHSGRLDDLFDAYRKTRTIWNWTVHPFFMHPLVTPFFRRTAVLDRNRTYLRRFWKSMSNNCSLHLTFIYLLIYACGRCSKTLIIDTYTIFTKRTKNKNPKYRFRCNLLPGLCWFLIYSTHKNV